MKIGAISASRIPSNTANSMQVMKTCQALVQSGHEVILLVPGHNDGPAEQKELRSLYGLDVAFSIEWLPAVSSLRRYDFSIFAAWRVRRLGVDLVITWPFQAALASQLLGIPTILEMHGPPEGKYGPSIFRMFVTHPGKKRLAFITQALQDIVKRLYPDINIAPISLIAPNGVELQKYAELDESALARRKLNLAEGMTAVYSGHLYPGRGMGLLLELAKRFPEIQFLWIGGRAEDVQYWWNRLALESLSNVNLVGFIPNEQLPGYQAAADILLMPYEKIISGSSGGNSASYASPMKMFEYMASGRPILASDLPVIREVLNQQNSILCPPEDLDSWTAAFRSLIEDDDLRRVLSRQALEDIQSYDWVQRAHKLISGFIDD